MYFDKQLRVLLVAVFCVYPFNAHSTNLPEHIVFASDPQYPWTESSDNGWEESAGDRDARSAVLIESQYSSIGDFRRSVSTDPGQVPVMINGDMTAFGHGGERSTVRSMLDKHLGGIYDYGLGNHDYANNVDDCFWNNCAAGSINDFKDRYWGHVASLDLAARSSGLGKIYYGSLAYSRSFGDVHMVQLNKEPTYAVDFSSGNPIAPTSFAITPALDWLEKDLKRAREQGKIIILNMHQVYDWAGSQEQISRFRQMIETYKVTAVFAGHDHWGAGTYARGGMRQFFGEVPVFLSGSASQQTYLIASFSSDRNVMNVDVVRYNNWRGRTLDGVVAVLR